jgi:hypothetical protein
MRDVVDLAPAYQREGGIWSTATRQTLIDSILNGLDIPKLYFETESTRRRNPASGLAYQYAVIDGKQRLETILQFLSGDLALADDFRYFEDDTVDARKMTLPQLEQTYPALGRRFLDYELPVVSVTTDSGDLIEEMFQRLNAATSLNAAERRNAVSGATRESANSLAEHELLVTCSPIKNARYKYRELAAKFLAIEHQLATRGRIIDTKADTLYRLFLATHGANPTISEAVMTGYRDLTQATLERMRAVFIDADPLLASIGTLVVYYIVFRDLAVSAVVTRAKLLRFEEVRKEASRMAEDSPEYGRPANIRLRDYNAFVQSTNDGRALARRADILCTYVSAPPGAHDLSPLDSLGDGEPPESDTDEP